MGDDLAVGDISRVMRHRSWFRRRRMRALKQTGLLVLRRIGSPAAVSAIQDAASSGDRLLRRMARTVAS